LGLAEGEHCAETKALEAANTKEACARKAYNTAWFNYLVKVNLAPHVWDVRFGP